MIIVDTYSENKGVDKFSKGINPKGNVMAWLEFELTVQTLAITPQFKIWSIYLIFFRVWFDIGPM